MTGAPPDEALSRLVSDVLSSRVRPAARLMRQIEDDPAGARPALAALYPHAGNAHLMGITGNPGAGKSTLVSRLISAFRAEGDGSERVGVVAVDPSSPFSGGAILGDRIRMMDHAADQNVFIRSSASRGALGGISRSTDDIAHVMAAMGCGRVMIETVGVGQAEIDIVQLAHTVVVVLTPGYGDDVQALKAGLLEIADIFVVNKADHPGANRLAKQLRALWLLDSNPREGAWEPPILLTIARDGTGLPELMTALSEHRHFIATEAGGRVRERARVERLLRRLLEQEMHWRHGRRLDDASWSATVDAVVRRDLDPYTAATALADALSGS